MSNDTTTDTTIHTPTTVVLVDPTSPDGESALGAIGPQDTHVALVLQLTGRHSSALREFARAEDVGLSTAGWTYLDQLSERFARDGLVLETVLTNGPAIDADVEVLAHERSIGRVVLPSSMAATDRHLADRIRRLVPAEVTVAELVTTS